MNIETVGLLVKGWCLITGCIAAAMAAGIVQTGETELLGVSTKVWALFLGGYGVGCNSLVAFLSQSFGDWKAQRPAGSNGSATPAAKINAGQVAPPSATIPS